VYRNVEVQAGGGGNNRNIVLRERSITGLKSENEFLCFVSVRKPLVAFISHVLAWFSKKNSLSYMVFCTERTKIGG